MASYESIGKGFCGSVWTAPGSHIAFKRADGGPGRSLSNDWEMHNKVQQSLQQHSDIACRIPRAVQYVPAEDIAWWNNHSKGFPSTFSHCNTLVADCIPHMPQAVRERLIDIYCPEHLRATIKQNRADEHCLIRPYLGRRRIARRRPAGRWFSLRNYPLHIDQMEELSLDIDGYARGIADGLAVLYWVAQVDANDVEFVLAPPSDDQRKDVSIYESDVLGGHSLWILDFDCAHDMTMDEDGLLQAVRAYYRNDPFYPRPHQPSVRDQQVWSVFREHFLQTSERLVQGSRIRKLPKLFMQLLEAAGSQLAKDRAKLERD